MIRKAGPADADAILHCLSEAFAPYRAAYTADAFADTVLSPATIARRLAEMTVLVAIDGGEVAGTIACARVSAEEGHLRGMAVRPKWQGAGVAARLLAAAEAALADCARITLDTTAPLERAIRFYETHGYRRTGRVRDFFGMPLHEFARDLQKR